MATKGGGNFDDPSIPSFYVYNLVDDTSRKELWGPCAKFGSLVDESEYIEKELKGIILRGGKLAANFAKHPRKLLVAAAVRRPMAYKHPSAPHGVRMQGNVRDSRSFVDVARVMMSPRGKFVFLLLQKKLNEEVMVSLDGILHKVVVFEVDDEWFPFTQINSGSSSDLGEECGEDEGVLDM
ncbi:unnamed protein product [Lactuca virosa]|uniref:Uncharacterized protein n=1 Tax=Lactuca virosa TaxID=75947 RepID=A0AAU9P7R0_9ASTR|nr:unnamed protein product [Lactuca virosa]